jgi:hypothetical protein
MDGNSKAMPGAKLYFYQTGTSTLQNTYSDAGLTQANPNPVVADGNGLFGPIYLGTASDYKVILKTAADVTVWTVDPYFASGTSGRTAVADASYTATINDRTISYTSLTVTRTVTLPPALNFPSGTPLTVVDESSAATSTVTISLVPDGTDKIDGVSATKTAINAPYGWFQLESNGSNGWFVTNSSMASVRRGHLSGLTLSTAGSTGTFSVAAGEAADSTNVLMMALASAMSKTTSAWAVGSGNGALDTGTIANSTWYHVWLIQRPDTGVVDVVVSTSASSPTMPTSYTLKRRIGSMLTDGSAKWTAFVQDGDEFQWVTPVLDVNATNPGISEVSRTLSTPLGVRVLAKIQILFVNTDTAGSFVFTYVSDLSTTDSAPSGSLSDTGGASTQAGAQQLTVSTKTVFTNTSSQVRSRLGASDANMTLRINTLGWADRRGRDS